jgi:hypothetical protein
VQLPLKQFEHVLSPTDGSAPYLAQKHRVGDYAAGAGEEN